jgi:hypothetical protein
VPTYTLLNFQQDNAVQNTWYTAATLRNVEFTTLAMGPTTNNETLEMRITIEGVVWNIAAGIAITAAQWSVITALNLGAIPTVTFTGSATTATIAVNSTSVNYIPWLRGRLIKIEVRKTTAQGANSSLRVIGQYGKY